MNERFTRFIEDLKLFLDDLRAFLNPRSVSTELLHFLENIYSNQDRRTPLVFTIIVHIGALFFAIYGPMIIASKTHIPEVYTVDLYQVVEPPPNVKKVVVKKKTVVKPTPPPPAPAINRKAVSLSPIKKRLAKEKEEREKEKLRQDILKSKMEQIKLDFKKQQAEKEARKAASTAIERISDLYRKEKKYSDAQAIQTPIFTPTQTDTSANSAINSMRAIEAIDRYKARLVQHIDKFWKLPELKDWSDDLECVMIIKVNRDGSVISSFFKTRSSDQRFNQYVKKAVEDAIPLPPFPIDLPQQNDEIHVTFYPGGLM